MLKRQIHGKIKKEGRYSSFIIISKKIDIIRSILVSFNSSLMQKASIFSDWNGEEFASIWQIMDLVEVNNSGVHSSFFRSELYLSTEIFYPCWNKKLDCRQMKAEVRINYCNSVNKSELLICSPIWGN